jgi:hypothetical protein
MNVARRMWALFEPVHGVVYTPASRTSFEEAGLRGFWRAYFATRTAPLGPVGPAPVVASFFTFAPGMVARALPAVWQLAGPERALELRRRGALAALRACAAQPAGEAATLLVAAASAAEHSGRVLGSANAALPEPDEPLARLWQAATVLREHRGDGHVAALVTAGVTGIEALVLRAGLDLSREPLQQGRGWTDEQWQAAAQRLVERGWLDAEGRVTGAGRELYREVEEVTDRCAAGPWRALGERQTDRLAEMLAPMAAECRAAWPLPDMLGLPAIGQTVTG